MSLSMPCLRQKHPRMLEWGAEPCLVANRLEVKYLSSTFTVTACQHANFKPSDINDFLSQSIGPVYRWTNEPLTAVAYRWNNWTYYWHELVVRHEASMERYWNARHRFESEREAMSCICGTFDVSSSVLKHQLFWKIGARTRITERRLSGIERRLLLEQQLCSTNCAKAYIWEILRTYDPGRVDLKTSEWKTIRKQVIERDGNVCRYCGVSCGCEATVDHIVPYSKGGLAELSNLVCACRSCNSSKGDRKTIGAGRRQALANQ